MTSRQVLADYDDQMLFSRHLETEYLLKTPYCYNQETKNEPVQNAAAMGIQNHGIIGVKIRIRRGERR